MDLKITLGEKTQKKSSARVNLEDEKLVAFAVDQLVLDRTATLEKLLRESITKHLGKMPSKNAAKKRMKVENEDGFSLVYWVNKDESVKLVAGFTDARVGTDLETPNKIVCLWHYICLVDAEHNEHVQQQQQPEIETKPTVDPSLN